jgi:hypothetical protein
MYCAVIYSPQSEYSCKMAAPIVESSIGNKVNCYRAGLYILGNPPPSPRNMEKLGHLFPFSVIGVYRIALRSAHTGTRLAAPRLAKTPLPVLIEPRLGSPRLRERKV